MKNNLKKNWDHFKQASKIIPDACQTFSRSHLLYDKKFFPLFIKNGKNQYLYDIDNNKYLDFVSALGAVTIGYSIPEINKKIKKISNLGNTFSLTHTIEFEVAKLIKKLIPSAEMIKFGKNGTDVTSAAIRLSRSYTGKEDIAVCGYHGWQDWYIGSTNMYSGVLKASREKTHVFNYNNINSLEKIFKKKKLAAVILEPFSYELPKDNFLKKIKSLCKKNKTVLIFDEICTGFRVSKGGAQSIYDVKPDLTVLGKGMANGYPLSALVGEKKIMKKINKIFFSGTFAGEISSLYACEATIKYMIKYNVLDNILKKGIFLQKELNKIIKRNNLDKILSFTGHPSWLFLKIENNKYFDGKLCKAYIMQELIENNILFFGSFNLSFSHTLNDLKKVINLMDKIFYNLDKNKKSLKNFVKIRIPKSAFVVRKV